jgi:hypothetical protein
MKYHDSSERIPTPYGRVTLEAVTQERIDITTRYQQRDRPLRMGGRSIRISLELRYRAGRWKLCEMGSMFIKTADGRSLSARSQARLVRAIVPAVAAWAQAHPDVLRRADRQMFAINHRGMQHELPSLAASLNDEAQILTYGVEFRSLADADRRIYDRMIQIADALRAIAGHVSAFSKTVKTVRYQAEAA